MHEMGMRLVVLLLLLLLLLRQVRMHVLMGIHVGLWIIGIGRRRHRVDGLLHVRVIVDECMRIVMMLVVIRRRACRWLTNQGWIIRLFNDGFVRRG